MMQPIPGATPPIDSQQQQMMMMMQQTLMMQPTSEVTPTIDPQQQQWMMMQPTSEVTPAIDPQHQQQQWMMMQPTSEVNSQQQQQWMMMQPTSEVTPAIDPQHQQQQWMMMQPTSEVTPAIDPQHQQQQQQWMMMQPPPQDGFWPQQAQAQAQAAIDPQQQQWVMMQPPPQAGFWPQQAQLQQSQLMVQQYPQQVSSADEIRTLWIGGLQHWMDESYLYTCFASAEGFLSLRIICNNQTGQSEGYGFLEFVSHAAAQIALQNYNGLQMPNAEEFYWLNWAAFGVGEKRPEDYTIFVANLAPDVTDYFLQEIFRVIYPSVKVAKVATDRTTGHSKGYGFVMFGDENEQIRAMTEMNGMLCSSRRMRICPATRKNTTGYQQSYPEPQPQPQPEKVVASASDNTTLFVGGLDSTVTSEMLMQVFVQFGELVYVKIPVGKNCGFVKFRNRASAYGALQMLHGTVLGERPIRLSWATTPATKQVPPAGWVQT